MKTPANGKVYSFEKWRRIPFSGLWVGAQKPPQMGMLKIHVRMRSMSQAGQGIPARALKLETEAQSIRNEIDAYDKAHETVPKSTDVVLPVATIKGSPCCLKPKRTKESCGNSGVGVPDRQGFVQWRSEHLKSIFSSHLNKILSSFQTPFECMAYVFSRKSSIWCRATWSSSAETFNEGRIQK